MRRSSVALLALVLLLPAAAAASTSPSSCQQLANKAYKIWPKKILQLGFRSVSYLGRVVNVSLLWGSEPAHAAAALLAAQLRHVRRYSGVRLPSERSPHRTAALADHVAFNEVSNYDDLVVAVSTAWEPEPRLPGAWTPDEGRAPGLAGPRLAEFGASSVPVRRRLFACLTRRTRERSICKQLARWPFNASATELAHCDFVDAASPQDNKLVVYVLGEDEYNATRSQLQQCANEAGIPLQVHSRSRAGFNRTMLNATVDRSFLFLDYDMWQGAPAVTVVEPPLYNSPLYNSTHFFCKLQLNNAIAMRVADVEILQVHAPDFLKLIYDFNPSPESLSLILERQASGVDIEEAACQTALDAKKYRYEKNYDLYKYSIILCICHDDPNVAFHDKISQKVNKEMYKQTSKFGCDINLSGIVINCSDTYHMSSKLNYITRTASFHKLVGVVSMTVEGAAAASATAAANRVPLMLGDVVPEPEDGAAAADTTWRLGPRPRHIARALLHFVRESRWTRVAVLSQPTKLAKDYYDALKDETKIISRNFPILAHINKQEAQKILKNLQNVNARIVFVNADSRAASTILTEAVAARMGYADSFVWIVREWPQKDVACGTVHFTVSSWTRGMEDILPGKGSAVMQGRLKEVNPGHPWPPRAVSLVDALLSLVIGYRDVFQRLPKMRQDLHTGQMIMSLKESLIRTPVTGVSQELRFKERSIEETFVFVDQWCGSNFTQRLARWRVNATDGAVRGANLGHASFTPPAGLPLDDGASHCTVSSGDAFSPRCHDIESAFALLLLVLVPTAVLLAQRTFRRRLARLQQEQLIQLIARRRHVATVLAAYLVERSTLELHEELGAGRFGSVRLARLREPGRAPRYIAAKALRENAAPAEESEFLREACTIASLDHTHIVRLVGVCIADGPPLVLMELAFFGDLLGYLRARRHLVEGAVSETADGEAEHVSAAALTRLAREASEALQYLSVRGVVHRDVRAANCLVDVRRSLKLADFGMARDTVASVDGAPEYACRRRGLFPVLWMAPESLAHGVFSGASDVWALGVLVLELVTLGARPYGAMSPLRVLEYVAAGGSPPLPLDATPQTRGLARLCWARAAERRPSAAEVAAYLAAWPLALRPALLSENDEPADADSGFGESPSTELLPPDSPLHSLDQFDSLAATH